jgi:DNA-binding CsgD family transcriptional regulator
MPALTEQGLEFVASCSARPAAECASDFLITIRQMGFAAAACGAWVGVGRNRKNRFFFIDWPKDWLEFYEQNGFVEHDIMPIEARRRVGPFWFSDIFGSFKLTERQKQLYEAAFAYGWKDAFAVPIHGPGSMQGLVSMATRDALAFDATDCAVLEMMARAVWERCRTSVGFGMFDPDRARLSPREIECLGWAAAGKSDTEIAILVGIKTATAHFHIEEAKKRLGVRTRVEAVAVAVLHGLV